MAKIGSMQLISFVDGLTDKMKTSWPCLSTLEVAKLVFTKAGFGALAPLAAELLRRKA